MNNWYCSIIEIIIKHVNWLNFIILAALMFLKAACHERNMEAGTFSLEMLVA